MKKHGSFPLGIDSVFSFKNRGTEDMYVIVDLEWFETAQAQRYPTQIAAVRVDDEWSVKGSFASLMCPPEEMDASWEHMAFAGALPQEFLQAPSVQVVLDGMQRWLREDDVLCWWQEEPAQMFDRFVSAFLGQVVIQKKRILKPYFEEKSGRKVKRTPYEVSLARGLRVPPIEHCSKNDVFVVWQLMRSLNVSAGILEQLSGKTRSSWKNCLFVCDMQTELLHMPDSPCLENVIQAKGMGTIKSCVEKHYTPCPVCCMEKWNQELIEYNRKRVAQKKYNYIFLQPDNTFHRCDCEKVLLTTQNIVGTIYYDSCIQKGRTPCKICKPEPWEDTPTEEGQNIPTDRAWMSREEKQALVRYEEALKERNAAWQEEMTAAQRRDMLTLTATDCAFWAAAGYNTFHLRKCRRLNGLVNLKGFTTFQQAVHAGYQPCRECRPTAKQDVNVSVPLSSVQRESETVGDVMALCRQLKIRYEYEKPILGLQTSAAQWRINTELVPIVPEHKPGMSKEFHKQHRMFWSMTDVIWYIYRHDGKENIEFENMLTDSRKKWKL